LLKKLKNEGYHLVALEQTPKSVNIYKWAPKFPLALVVGNEKTGITRSLLKYCDDQIELNMKGKKGSLNVSVAAGIAMYYISSKL
jgi:tRNA G18 (ribose-2'-O)-methylase SpoU